MTSSFVRSISSLLHKLGIPQPVMEEFLPFATSYDKALESLGKTPPLEAFTNFLSCVAKQIQNPHSFSPYHQAIRSPFDYYQLGLDFVRDLVDFQNSHLFGADNLNDIQAAISNQENVILLSNHQTEIDPQLISLMIEKTHPRLAQEMIFVAGHRVTTDPLAVPMSLGRNLICIYSKRHIDNPPEKREEKLQHNMLAMKKLNELLAEGGKCIYIAPSGGRDRINQEGIVEVAPFDPQSVEMFYLLARKSPRPTHFHTLALSTYHLLPPPDHVLVNIGESRYTSFSPVHLFFGARLDMPHLGNCHLLKDKQEQREARTKAAWQQVHEHYLSFP